MTLADLWPATAVRARAGDLELRWPDDAVLLDLAELASRGVHAPDAMPFQVPWTRGTPREVARSVLTYQWGVRGRVGPEALQLELAVLVAGEPVGMQGAGGRDWAVLRTAETGSWLGREHQGRGIGSRMRALMLELLFDGLDARAVTSGAWADNGPSNAVSRRVGYLHDGDDEMVRDGRATLHHRYRMTRERWLEVRDANRRLLGAPVEMSGVRELRAELERPGDGAGS
ncbi:RimJ/RimL family protein N-acetyltransferase [Salana multivorans]|uniref:RimJ/RimL family protein N-acetyltransferase n=1 Tax=Salana multivorans TaxID=120377 RepID=A0A3N2DD88_9MICO|nr:GNAT family protein [Salana multivorans]ROR97394.1 RimJ/RimL family protein N-acetyltransferase [Salana multivorans]